MSWLVLGAGISGRGAATLLRKRQHSVRLCDDRPLTPDIANSMRQLGVELVEGKSAADIVRGISSGLVLSPGISLQHPVVQAARAAKVPIVSEIDVALAEYSGKLIGVTGTNGKSTVSAMVHYLLHRKGVDVALAGNIGISLCQYFAEHPAPQYLVLELSSYQLELSQRVHADVGIIINLSPDHLERHGSEKTYYAAKWRLFSEQSSSAYALITTAAWEVAKTHGFARPTSRLQVVSPKAEAQLYASLPLPEVAQRHNRQNATLAALAVAAILGEDPSAIAPLISGYQGLPHRFQIIAQRGKVAIINDSKATNVAATLTALASCDGRVILMLGGKGKGESFLPLLQYRDRIERIVAFGYSAQEIAAQLQPHYPLRSYPTLKQALQCENFSLASLATSLLFSPACASFDEFANFERRGEFFAAHFLL